jgi:hypothetical protein
MDPSTWTTWTLPMSQLLTNCPHYEIVVHLLVGIVTGVLRLTRDVLERIPDLGTDLDDVLHGSILPGSTGNLH